MTMLGDALLAAMAGAIAGSYLSTLAVRLEDGRSIRHGRSLCDHCGALVRARDNVPILGWLALSGRCRDCGGAIDARHPMLEAVCSLLTVASVVAHPGLSGWAGAAFGWLLATLAVIDARLFRLPHALVLTLAALGLAGAVAGLAPALLDRLWGAGGGFATLTAIRLGYRLVRGRDGMGAGDPRLLAAIGLWLGWRPLPWVVLAAAAMGIGWAGVSALAGRRIAADHRLPLGTLLALAAWPAWVLIA